MRYGRVRCNCYIDGKTPPPPNTEYVLVQESGIDWNPTPSEKGQKDSDFTQAEIDFADWRLLACPHLDMLQANLYLGTDEELGTFIGILKGMGDFPLLSQHLSFQRPLGDTLLESQFNQALLKELDFLQDSSIEYEIDRLIDKKQEAVIASAHLNGPPIKLNGAHTPVRYYFSADGFYIVKSFEKHDVKRQMVIFSKDKIMFKSKHFQQETLRSHYFLLTDLETQATFEAKDSIVLGKTSKEPLEFVVSKEITTLQQEYASLLINLRALVLASIETGNSIYWK